MLLFSNPCSDLASRVNWFTKNKSFSYTRSCEYIFNKLKEVTGNLKISLHSMRAGCATSTANASVTNAMGDGV